MDELGYGFTMFPEGGWAKELLKHTENGRSVSVPAPVAPGSMSGTRSRNRYGNLGGQTRKDHELQMLANWCEFAN